MSHFILHCRRSYELSQSGLSRRVRRHALVTICVLVCLVVASSIAMLTLRKEISMRRELSLHQQMRQTELLLEAGVRRAATRLKESPDYHGETWKPTHALKEFSNAQVVIDLTNDDHVRIVASIGRLPEDSSRAASGVTQLTHQFRVPTTKPSPSE